MPYQGGRLPAEYASKLGHLEVLNSNLVNELCRSFESQNEINQNEPPESTTWPEGEEACDIIFGVDGSFQSIQSDGFPKKELSFVKTAMLRLDIPAIKQLDPHFPHPLRIRDILRESAVYHATVFPLRNISSSRMNLYDTIRQIIFDSLRDPSLDKEIYETAKWLFFEKWDTPREMPLFDCPYCRKISARVAPDADHGICGNCQREVLFTDVFGFHIELGEDYASGLLSTNYMSIHETLLLFTGIRYFWENHRSMLSNVLFVKDGPLYLRSHFTKLINPIRRFIQFAADKGVQINIVGQEKSGVFFDHLEEICHQMPNKSVIIPNNQYIREEIQKVPMGIDPYGFTSNYGAKLLLKYDDYHHMVINIPTGRFVANPTENDLIGYQKIMATLPTIFSAQHQGGLVPIELAHGVASLSTYPSARIMKLFAEDLGVM